VIWHATDAAGNIGSATQSVTIQDTTPPQLTVPADVSVVSATALAVDLGTASATDLFGPVVISNDAPAQFQAPSTTTVIWTAQDQNGNRTTAPQTVKVVLPPLAALLAGLPRAKTRGTIKALAASLPRVGGKSGKVRIPLRRALLATGVRLSSDLSSPQVAGTVVTFSASGPGGSGTYLYRYRHKSRATGKAWQVMQGWSARSGYAWDTTGNKGANRIQVQVRRAGTQDKPVSKTMKYKIN